MLRQTLGEFCSIACFKAAFEGIETALGEKAATVALTSAGRKRGKNVIQSLALSNSSLSFDEITSKLRSALGKEGTCLCVVEKIVQEGDAIKVYVSDTLTSAWYSQNSNRVCTYTLGAIWGALEELIGKRFQGKQTEFVLCGAGYDVFEFTEF